MFIDSHCHINFPELASDLPCLLDNMARNQVTHALCVSVDLAQWGSVIELADRFANIYASVGVHPNYEETHEPSIEELVRLAQRPKVVAIGETGLDYYRLQGDLNWQRDRFRTHIRAARACGKPLIIHTRSAADDTLAIMQEENAASVGGVMHCFTESWEVAQRAIEMNFLISFSGILTFKNADELRKVARNVPLSRMLIETDAPYLAPVPVRGKTNQPAFVKHVAEEIGRIKDVALEEVGSTTSTNFNSLFLGG